MDPRTQKVAQVLVNYSTGVRPGDKVVVDGPVTGLPLLEALYVETLKAGGFPIISLRHPHEALLLCKFGNEHQIRYVRESEMDDLRNADVWLTAWAEQNTKQMSEVDTTLQQMRLNARRPFRDLFHERMGTKALRWCGTEFPTQATAQDAEMSLMEYEDFVYGACRVDTDDPVAEWRAVRERQQKLVDFLKDKNRVRVIAPDTDITLEFGGRTFINACGDCNMPDGEVFTSPVEGTANGQIRYTFPACYQGREVEDVTLVFKDGRVVEEHAAKNLDYLTKMLDSDEGARVLGEFAFGLNRGVQRFSKNILFDEKIGGTVHLAVGSAFTETGGTNKSALHWDMICDLRQGGEIQIDGQTVMKDGTYILDELKDL